MAGVDSKVPPVLFLAGTGLGGGDNKSCSGTLRPLPQHHRGAGSFCWKLHKTRRLRSGVSPP